MKVELIDKMGTDLTVVNAARVSFSKASSYEENHDGTWSLSDKDQNLIRYLAEHNHWSPFSHPQVMLRIKAPIFVARQLQKHQVGLSWNEVSRRYVDSEPEFYDPVIWRKRAENVKQGSSDEYVNLCCVEGLDRPDMEEQLRYLINDAQAVYRKLLAIGVCPEQARMVLPQSMLTEWYWTGSLYAFSRVVRQRTNTHAQRETREVAEGIAKVIKPLFPVSWKELVET